MPKGKRQFSRPPAGGVTRNDYHRRNRKRHISTHCTSHGYQTGIRPHIRVIKRDVLESLLLREHNAHEDAAFHGRELVTDDVLSDTEYSAALSALRFQAALYCPPFLKREEIKARRFSDQYGEMNDRWWEWEREIKSREERGRFKWR